MATEAPLLKLPTWLKWLDSDAAVAHLNHSQTLPVVPKYEITRFLPFAFLHLGCLGVIWSGASPFAVGFAVAFYFIRIFFITAFYHRYFSHRSYKTNRFNQFLFGVLGVTAVQRGPLWWASHHRRHHQTSDTNKDFHSPVQFGFWWSHIGWMTQSECLVTDYQRVPDLSKYPELVWLNRFDWLIPVLMFPGMYFLGAALETYAPQLGTNGFQMLVWGFFISTVVLFHGTCTINSLSHLFGSQRYKTPDQSRNNLLFALITLGEGWHNNHHRFQATVRQGFFWWEIDITFYILKLMEVVGMVSELVPVPAIAYSETIQKTSPLATTHIEPAH